MRFYILLSAFICLTIALPAQNLTIEWSDRTRFDNRVDGWPEEILDKNGNFVYVKYSNLALKKKKKNKSIKILAYSNRDMSLGAVAELKGFDDNYDDLEYENTVVSANHVFVFWRKPKKKKDNYDLMVESFSTNLKKEGKLAKIMERKYENKNQESIRILSNKKVKDKFVLVKLLDPSASNGVLKIEYKVFNASLAAVKSGHADLPIPLQVKKGLFGNSKGYDLNDLLIEWSEDGKIYVQQIISLTKEEIKAAKKNESHEYTCITQISPDNNRTQHYVMRFPEKNSFRYKPVFSSTGLKLYGFFSDLNKDPSGADLHGIFVVSVDNNDFSKSITKFNYFTKKFLDQLYMNDKEDRKKGGALKSKKAKDSNLESISGNYVVEFYANEGKDLVLFCSKMRSYWIQNCSGTGASRNCRTDYYCEKSNVTVFKFNEGGDITWASNLDRKMIYQTPRLMDVYDVRVLVDKNGYYVSYGSAYEIDANSKNFRSRKGKKKLLNYLEYAVFQKKTGEYKKFEYEVNAPGTPKRERKFIHQDAIHVFDNVMYTISGKSRLKWGYYFTLLFPPVYVAMILNGNHYKANGYLGTIKLK